MNNTTANNTPLQLSLDINANHRPLSSLEAGQMSCLALRAHRQAFPGMLPYSITISIYEYYVAWESIYLKLPFVQIYRGEKLAGLMREISALAIRQDKARTDAETLYLEYSCTPAISAVLA